jgi:hypothetical protein
MLVIEGSRRLKLPSILRQVEAYWEGLRPLGDIPNRDQVQPRGLESALDYSFILEFSKTGEVVFRLSGERLGDLLGMPLERVPLAALFARNLQKQVKDSVGAVFQSPGILRAEITSVASVMQPALHGHLLILPLRGPDQLISRALGVLYFDGNVGKAPRQFTQFNHNMTRVMLCNAVSIADLVNEPMGMAEAPAEFAHKKGRPEGRPNLKIISGGLK